MNIYPTFEKRIGDIKRQAESIEHVQKALGYLENTEMPFKHQLVLSNPNRLEIYSIKDLIAARALLRLAFGSWQDSFQSSFNSGTNKIIAVWKNPLNPDIDIWVEAPAEEIPPNLLTRSKQCHWEKVTRTSEELTLVCTPEGGPK